MDDAVTVEDSMPDMPADVPDWLWKKIEPKFQAAITNRILLFHEAMINRGQIKPIPHPDPASKGEVEN